MLDPLAVYGAHAIAYWATVCVAHATRGAQFPEGWCVYATRVAAMQLFLTPLFAPALYGLSRPLESAAHAAWQIPVCTLVTEAIFSPLHPLMH